MMSRCAGSSSKSEREMPLGAESIETGFSSCARAVVTPMTKETPTHANLTGEIVRMDLLLRILFDFAERTRAQPRGGGSGTRKARERVDTTSSDSSFSAGARVKRSGSEGSEKMARGGGSASLRDSQPLLKEQDCPRTG